MYRIIAYSLIFLLRFLIYRAILKWKNLSFQNRLASEAFSRTIRSIARRGECLQRAFPANYRELNAVMSVLAHGACISISRTIASTGLIFRRFVRMAPSPHRNPLSDFLYSQYSIWFAQLCFSKSLAHLSKQLSKHSFATIITLPLCSRIRRSRKCSSSRAPMPAHPRF